MNTTNMVIMRQNNETNGTLQLRVHIDAELHVSELMARRTVTNYLIDNVSDHFGGEKPTLLIEKDTFIWRVPVALFLTAQGRVGSLGHIDVHAHTGQLLLTPNAIQRLKQRANELVNRSPSPAVAGG